MAVEFALVCGVDSVALDSVITIIRTFNIGLKQKIVSIDDPEFNMLEALQPTAITPYDMSIKPKITQAKLYSEDGKLFCWISIIGLYSYLINLSDDRVNISISEPVYYYGDSDEFYNRYNFKGTNIN